MANKIVEFAEYCSQCKYSPLKQDEEPCNECLTNPVNEDSRKPIMFEYEDKKAKGVNLRGEPREE